MPFVPVCIYSVALSIVHAEQFKQEIILLLKSLRIQFVISAIGVITLTNILLLPISKSINMSKFTLYVKVFQKRNGEIAYSFCVQQKLAPSRGEHF